MPDERPAAAPGSDLYATLGVPRTASADEIRAAYFRLVRVHTPEDAPERFQAISEAYRVLSDPEERRRYDAAVRLPPAVEAALAKAAALVAKDPDAAAGLAEKIAANPAVPPDGRHAAALICLEAKRPEAAVPILEDLVRRHPDLPQFGYSRAQALAASGDLSRAEQVLRGVLAAQPANLRAMHFLASLLGARGAEEEALNLVERAVRSAGAAGLRGLPFQLVKLRILGRAGRFADLDRAAAAIRRAIPEGDDAAARHVAESFHVLGEEHVAEEAFDVAKRLIDCAYATVRSAAVANRSAELSPFAESSAACRAAHADGQVPEWIRGLLGPRFGRRVPAKEWTQLCVGIHSKAGRIGAAMDRDWAAFRKHHPAAARAIEPVWSKLRERGAAAARETRAQRKAAPRETNPLVMIAVFVVCVVGFALLQDRKPAAPPGDAPDPAVRKRLEEALGRLTPEERREFAEDAALQWSDPAKWAARREERERLRQKLLGSPPPGTGEKK